MENVTNEETRNEAIGRTVAAWRGDMSQKELADKMREKGHKWVQSTVWSVESGTRPLRLTEAEDLAEIFGEGTEGLVRLVDPAGTYRMVDLIAAFQAEDEVERAIRQYILRRVAAAKEVNDALANGEFDRAGTTDRLHNWVRWVLSDLGDPAAVAGRAVGFSGATLKELDELNFAEQTFDSPADFATALHDTIEDISHHRRQLIQDTWEAWVDFRIARGENVEDVDVTFEADDG